MKIKINLQRKHKYALLSLTVSMLLFLFSYDAFNLRVFWAIFVVLTGVFGSIWVQYTSVITSKQYFFKQTLLNVLVLPVILVVGALLSLIYFPNLGLPTRIITLLSVGGVMYVVSLVNNIFLVVFEKNEVIPLYRVAVTWSQY